MHVYAQVHTSIYIYIYTGANYETVRTGRSSHGRLGDLFWSSQFARVAGWGTYFGVRSSHGWPRHCFGSISTPKRSFLDLRTDLKKSLTSGIQW